MHGKVACLCIYLVLCFLAPVGKGANRSKKAQTTIEKISELRKERASKKIPFWKFLFHSSAAVIFLATIYIVHFSNQILLIGLAYLFSVVSY